MEEGERVLPGDKHRPRLMPQRTCVACGEVKYKRELIRLVNTQNGRVEIDLTGKAKGRGAYLCREWECWEKALRKNRLERALRGNIAPENRISLIEQGRAILLANKDD